MSRKIYCQGCQNPLPKKSVKSKRYFSQFKKPWAEEVWLEWLYYKAWCGWACKNYVRTLSCKCRNERFATSKLRAFILERDNYHCQYCGYPVTNETANIDHIKPWPLGRTVPRNLTTACRQCNKNKMALYGMRVKQKNGQRKLVGHDRLSKYHIARGRAESDNVTQIIHNRKLRRTVPKNHPCNDIVSEGQ